MTIDVAAKRVCIECSRTFEEVLAELAGGIGRPDMRLLQPKLDEARTLSEFQDLIEAAVGTADLMEFLRLDLGGAMRKDPDVAAYRIVRIIAGNPLIMKKMVAHVPHAGSYAPITLIVYEAEGKVHICYDTMVSMLAVYQNESALKVAADLDAKVLRLLAAAAA